MFIYKIINIINNKFYIGKTTRNLQKRFEEHTKTKSMDKMPIQKAIHKYGKDNFIIKQIDTASDKEELNIKEIYYIDILKPQYNISSGGDGGNLFLGHKHNKETKEKIRLSRIGKKHQKKQKIK